MSGSPLERIGKGLAAGYPLFYICCQEEERLEGLLGRLAQGRSQALWTWTSTHGFVSTAGDGVEVRDPLAALQHILDASRQGFYLLKDLPAFFTGNPALVRGLRDLYRAGLAERRIHVFLSYPRIELPESLNHQLFMVDLGIPSEDEIVDYMRLLAETREPLRAMPEVWYRQCASAMKGMALNDVRHLLTRLLAEGRLEMTAIVREIHEEKAAALMKEGCLRHIARTVEIDQVGGLENLKEWVLSRRVLFSRHLDSTLPLPAGILFMGVSGCGKSMAAKLIASAWGLPLVRLDMNLVMSGAYGSPEYAFDHALRVAEEIAPLVLWIDEMENSFGYDEAGRGNNSNIFSGFLTWMQEKPPAVFVVATANRIEKLPAEVIRKGRFDQLFFLDLPSEEERRQILAIHLRAAGGDPASFNLGTLAAATRNWSGAEIEQAIKSGVIRAFQEERPFTDRDVLWSTGRMVPLSRTMEEQIKRLRLWSQERATPASKKTS